MDKKQLERFVAEYHDVLLWRLQNRARRAPHFIGVGSGRAGTSSLYEYLRNHPKAYLPPIKELNYFGFRTTETHPDGWSFAEYKNLFLAAQPGQILGEFSPIYLSLPGSLELIKKYIPDCKLIITLREPIERAISHFVHHQPNHHFADAEEYFRKALELHSQGKNQKFDWFSPVKALRQSFYADDISRAIELFTERQVFFVVFDDMKDDASPLLADLARFLGLPHHEHALPKKNQRQKKSGEPQISEATRSKMAELFRPDVERTAKLLQRDLTKWLDTPPATVTGVLR
jgi:hypothetical protein